MEITFLGQASFRLKGKTTTVVTDPFDPQMVGLPFPKVTGQIVTISHDHQDHNRADLVAEVEKVISSPGEYEIGGTSFLGIASWHDNQHGQVRGANTIFVIEMDGLRLAHLGDLGHTLKTKKVEEIGQIDILMVPVGGEYTLGPKEAAEVVGALEPKVILPMHYQMPGLKAETFAKLLGPEAFLTEVEIKSEKGDKLKISPSDLPQEDQIIYLLAKK